MKIFQIHIGELHPDRERCILSVRNFYSDCEYLMIDDLTYKQYLEKVFQDYSFKRPEAWDNSSMAKRIIMAEWIKYWYLSKHPDTLAIGTDVEILKRIQFDVHTPQPVFGTYVKEGPPEEELIYNGKCLDYFKNLIEKCICQNHFGKFTGHFPVGVIKIRPDDFYIHYGDHFNRKLTTEKHCNFRDFRIK